MALKLTEGAGEHINARMCREAEVAARFDDPGMVRVLDLGTHEKGYYLAMERLHGRDLDALVEDRGPLPVLGACSIVAEVAATCARLHGSDIVHRDLKPANIFLCDAGPVKLIDFGLAKDCAVPSSLTTTGMTMGTAAFIAPEQVSSARHAGPPADCYALGGVLLYALTGKVPHDAPSPVEQFAQAIGGEAPDLAALRPGVPAELAELLRRLLDREPAARPTAAEVAEGLEALVASHSVARPGGPAVR